MCTKLAECQTLSSNFAIAHRYLLRSEQLFPHLLKQNWKLSFVKLIHKRTNVCESATKCKTGSGRPRTARTVDACNAWSHACCSSFATRSTFSAVRTAFSLLLPVLSFVKNFADPVTVHVHEYVYISILLISTFSVNQ